MNLEQTNQQEIQSKNKELIDEVRKQSTKPKKKEKTWLTVVWVCVLIAATIAIIVGIATATTKNATGPVDNYINVSITGTDPQQNQQLLSGLRYPNDVTDYPLYVTNDKESINAVYIRFFATTYVNDQKTSINLIELITSSNSNIYYDEATDMFYYVGEVEIGGKVQICSKIRISSQASNEQADKYLKFTITVDALSVESELWDNVPQEWLDRMDALNNSTSNSGTGNN